LHIYETLYLNYTWDAIQKLDKSKNQIILWNIDQMRFVAVYRKENIIF
jgi:uncharacterized protein YjcR